MSKITVCGLVNLETTVAVDSFPIEYRPVDYNFFGVNSAPSGVGLNVSAALSTLGDEVSLCTLCADDPAADIICSYLNKAGINTKYISRTLNKTAQSVVLYDKNGKRSIICDLTDNQEASYDKDTFRQSLKDSKIVCLCNINYAADLISVAKDEGVPIATDVHCLSDIKDEYNSRFMKAADIIFLSNENIKGREEEFVRELCREYTPLIVVVGMGDKGALLFERGVDTFTLVPAVYTRKVVNTVGAGDSLYSAFIHFYAKSGDPLYSLKCAVYFASYKIGEKGASQGFLSEDALLDLIKRQEE